eukprot:c9830_g1_i1.p1 GENE.c9830_g1_i1~~c9830_g1_i1.p1  ORF type:complete len:643 (+),score=146.21 c9830_g1_i1:35-1963(+)
MAQSITSESIRSLHELQRIVKGSYDVQSQIERDQIELDRLRQMITVEVKQNMMLDADLKELDETIKLFVRQKMSVRELIASSQKLRTDRSESTGTLKSKKAYEDLFDLLQQEPHYLAKLARRASALELPALVQVIIFSIYGDQYEARLERFLLLMLEMMLETEFALCNNMGEFMRANTAITQLLSAYCRRGKGMGLLKEILQPILSRVALDSELDLEISPGKVYQWIIKKEEMDTGKESSLPKNLKPEEIEAHPLVMEIVRERVAKLESILNEVFDAIANNAHHFPFGIRWISRRMREMCEQKWPNATPDEVESIVGGLCFLRFITPAITTPDSLNIIEQHITYRRNFILIAKVMQNLSNHVPFGNKEDFMVPMNSFLESHQVPLKKFFEDLCQVETLDAHMRMELLCILSKREQYINIAVNDIYHVQGLLEKYHQHIIQGPDDKLTTLLSVLGPTPPKVEREQDFPINLLVAQSNHQSSYSIDLQVATEDEAYAALKSKLVDFLKERTIPEVSDAGVATILRQMKEEASKRQEFGVASQLKEILNTIAQLVSDKRFASPEHIFIQLFKDISRNIEMQKNLRLNLHSARKMLDDIRSQRADMEETLQLHNQYLENVEKGGNMHVATQKNQTGRPSRQRVHAS